MRLRKLDIAKGIGILLIVQGHVHNTPTIHDSIFLFHLPLFYTISGYLYNKNYTIIETIEKKARSLLIPCGFFMILLLMVSVPFFKLIGTPVFISFGILLHPWGVVGSLWFFYSLFCVVVMFKIIDRIVPYEILKLIAVLVLFFGGLLLGRQHIEIPFYVDSSLTVLIFYAIGYWGRKYLLVEKLLYVGGAGVAIYYFVTKQIPVIDLKTNTFSDPLCIFLSSSASFLLIRISALIEKTKLDKVFAYLGEKSLIIFPLHLLFFEFIYLVVARDNYYSVLVSSLSVALILITDKLVRTEKLLLHINNGSLQILAFLARHLPVNLNKSNL